MADGSPGRDWTRPFLLPLHLTPSSARAHFRVHERPVASVTQL